MLSFAAIQSATYGKLKPALAPVRVLDQAGPDEFYPFVTLGEFSAGGVADILDHQAIDVEMTIHVWSRQLGMRECEQLMEIVKAALHAQPLTLATAQWVMTTLIYAQTLRDPDGLTRHGVLRFRVMTFEQ
jgi:hypothetical protein